MADNNPAGGRFSPQEMGTATAEKGVSTEPNRNVDAGEPWRRPATEPRSLEKGAIFLLGVRGYIDQGTSRPLAQGMYDLSVKLARHMNQEIQKQMKSGVVKYDYFDRVTFNSISDILASRAPAEAGGQWRTIVLITHSSADIRSSSGGRAELSAAIWLGDDNYSVNDLLRMARSDDPEMKDLWKQFRRSSPVKIIACGPAVQARDLAMAVRDFFGVEGEVSIPKVTVNFDKDTGLLGTPVAPGSLKLRDLKPSEWLTLPPKSR